LFRNGAALLFNATTSTSFTATSVTFNGYNGNFFYGNAPSLFKISSSQFLNIYQTLGLPFIYLKSKPGTTTVSHSISDCNFTDVKVRISLILIETNAFTLQLNNVNMKNIAKINVPPQEKTMDELTLESQFSGGICALARDSTFLSLSSSTFTNIYSHCIGVSQAALTISLSIFNNTNIDPSYKTSFTSTTSFGSLDETDGVSFIIYQDATSEISPQTKVGVTSSQFIENNIYSKYGGVVLCTKFT